MRRSRTSSAVINTAIKLAETDNPRDNDTRSPAERRGEALADVCNFHVDYKNRLAADPDADAAAVPKKRNWPHLIGVNTTDDMANRAGAQLLDGPRIDHQAYEALSCTAQLLRLLLDENGAIRSYEMMPASVTDALFGAIAARDQHCRWPGCHKEPIHCDVHHLHHRENGGVNSPCNCCLLCKYHHHRAAHDPKIRMVMEPDLLVRLRRNGPAKPPFPQSDNPDSNGLDATVDGVGSATWTTNLLTSASA